METRERHQKASRTSLGGFRPGFSLSLQRLKRNLNYAVDVFRTDSEAHLRLVGRTAASVTPDPSDPEEDQRILPSD